MNDFIYRTLLGQLQKLQSLINGSKSVTTASTCLLVSTIDVHSSFIGEWSLSLRLYGCII